MNGNAMKRIKSLIVVGFVFAISASIFFRGNVVSSSEKVPFGLIQVESLARGEGDILIGCCPDPDSYCKTGDVILAYHRLCEM